MLRMVPALQQMTKTKHIKKQKMTHLAPHKAFLCQG